MSGVEVERVSPSISVVIPDIGVPVLSKVVLEPTAKCKSEVETKLGVIAVECVFCPNPVTISVRAALVVALIIPKLVPAQE